VPRVQSRLGGPDRMRLVITAGPPDIWVGLEPETGEEAMALEACAARGSGRTDAERTPSCGFRRWRRGSASRSLSVTLPIWLDA
jgi:hypothetical protein